jgi:ribulose-phosphate 3-epimerase
MTVSASLLAADILDLKSTIRQLENVGINRLHLDVMDGHYVPNLSFGPAFIQAIKKETSLPCEVHLMTSPVGKWVEPCVQAGADFILVHPDAEPHIHRVCQHIKALGKKVGVVLNPGTSLDSLAYVLPMLDQILVMTVNPGFGGQAFIDTMISKVNAVKDMATGYPIEIAVDGGVGPQNIPELKKAGTDVFVCGTSLFSPGIAAGMAAIQKAFKGLYS